MDTHPRLRFALGLLAMASAHAGDYQRDYAELKERVAADKRDAHLAAWRTREPANPDAWVLSANWAFEQAMQGGVALTTKPADQGEFAIVDPKTGQAVGSIGSQPHAPRVKEATGYLREALEHWPHRLDLHTGLAHMWQETGAWPEQMTALRAMTAAAKAHAGKLRWCHDEALAAPEPVFLAQKLHRFALNQFRRETPQGDARFREVVDLLIEACPDQAIGYNDLAVFHSLTKNYAEVDQALRKAVEVAPDDALVWLNLGDNSRQLGQSEQARAAYEKVLALQPGEASVAQAKAGLAALAKKKPKPAAKKK